MYGSNPFPVCLHLLRLIPHRERGVSTRLQLPIVSAGRV